MVIETVGIIFLMCRNDVVEPRILTEEPEDHVFGNCRMQKREFTVAELITMETSNEYKFIYCVITPHNAYLEGEKDVLSKYYRR